MDVVAVSPQAPPLVAVNDDEAEMVALAQRDRGSLAALVHDLG